MRFRDALRERQLWLLLALVAAVFRKPLTTETFFFRDLYLLFYPKKLLFVQAIRAGELPLWDPYTNGGQPYLASPANYAFHPANVLYLIAPPIVAFNLVLALHVLFCAAAAYWLARVIGLSPQAAVASGAVFALCGYTLSAANLMQLLLGLPWVPMTIALTHRALRDGRSIAAPAGAAAMLFFGSAVELAGLLFATLIVWVAVADVQRPARPRVAAAAIVIVFAVVLSLLATLPATDVVAQSSRSERRTYDMFTSWSVDPRRLPELVVPRFLGPIGTLDDRDYWGRGLESEGFPYILSLYFGLPALILAAAGALGEENRRLRRALAAIAAAALLLALGRNLPVFELLYELPLVAIFRYPVKAIGAVVLPIALLAGYGVESFHDRRRVALIAASVAALVAAGLLTSSGFAATFSDLFGFQTLSPMRLGASFVHASVAALVLALATRAGKRRLAAIAAVVALDLAVAGDSVNVYAPRTLFDEPPLAAQVRSIVGTGRFHAAKRDIVLRAPTNDLFWLARWQIATLAGYTAAIFRIPVVYHLDYDGFAPRRIATLSGEMDRLPWDQRRAILARADVRAFTTTDAVPGAPVLAALRTPGAPIVLYGNPSPGPAHFRGPCGSAPVALLRRSLNDAWYRADAPCDGMVVFAETYYRGWTAQVDGKPAPIVPADYAFSAVAVGKGAHVIERRYFPPRLVAGAVCSALGLILLVPIDLWWRRR